MWQAEKAMKNNTTAFTLDKDPPSSNTPSRLSLLRRGSAKVKRQSFPGLIHSAGVDVGC